MLFSKKLFCSHWKVSQAEKNLVDNHLENNSKIIEMYEPETTNFEKVTSFLCSNFETRSEKERPLTETSYSRDLAADQSSNKENMG